MADSEHRKKGIEVMTRLFGEAPAGGGAMPDEFFDYTVEHLFGRVWGNDALPVEQRSLLTCTVLVALGRENEQRIHFRGAQNIGIEKATLEAAIAHVAHYAGWPTAATAYRVLQEVWQD